MQVSEWKGTHVAVVRPASGGFPRHSHDEYVISVNLSGRELVRLDRSSFEAGVEDVTVYNPGQVQSCTTRTSPGTVWGCVSWYVPPAFVRALTGDGPAEFERPVIRSARLRAELLDAARTMRGARGDGARGDGDLAGERLTLLLLRLLDLAGGPRAERSGEQGAAGCRMDGRVGAVMERLRGDLSSAPRLADLARESGMSREHLIRSFTRATGSPPYAWHLQARLAEGRRRLRRGAAVADVAQSLGFADQAHFHRHFTAAYAITPGRYRRLRPVNI